MSAGGNREDALSDALGAILLVAVVGMAVALLGVALLSQPHQEKIPALNADITTIDRTILISHNGGDTVQKADLKIIVDGFDLKDSFKTIDNTPWSSWSVGDSLYYTVPSNQPMPQGVTIFYVGGAHAQIITSMGVPQTVSAGGLYLTGTITPVITTSTPTPTPTPVIPLPVLADFSANPVTGLVPLSTQFSDASTGPVTNWSWSFGDSGTSFLRNPLHQYSAAGTYSVGLVVSNGTGTSTATKTSYITVTQYAPGLLANYFNDQSWSVPAITKIANRVWYADSASGASSDLLNWPMDYIGETDDFSVSFDGYLYVPTNDTYTFYLTSDDGSFLSLDGVQVINNGGVHSAATVQVTRSLTAGYHPIQVRMFENGGEAVVHLEYSTPTVARTPVTSLYHTPNTPPLSDFTATPRVGSAPLIVQFTDTSVDASGWTWNFGDGSPASNAKNPLHTYSTGGSYTVALTTTNGIGSNTVNKENYIVIGTLTPGFISTYYPNEGWVAPGFVRTPSDTRIRFADISGNTSTQFDPTDEIGWPLSTLPSDEHFSVIWDGYWYVPVAGTHDFLLKSDDGSYLYVDDSLIVDNGGPHSPQIRYGSVPLTVGYHHIVVKMFEMTGQAVARLDYKNATMADYAPVTNLGHV